MERARLVQQTDNTSGFSSWFSSSYFNSATRKRFWNIGGSCQQILSILLQLKIERLAEGHTTPLWSSSNSVSWRLVLQHSLLKKLCHCSGALSWYSNLSYGHKVFSSYRNRVRRGPQILGVNHIFSSNYNSLLLVNRMPILKSYSWVKERTPVKHLQT
jgi:hypothetical protein